VTRAAAKAKKGAGQSHRYLGGSCQNKRGFPRRQAKLLSTFAGSPRCLGVSGGAVYLSLIYVLRKIKTGNPETLKSSNLSISFCPP
jgi:hypothetical protein